MRKQIRPLVWILVFSLLLPIRPSLASDADEQSDVVVRVIDANTLLLKSGTKVRLIGVRAPSPYDKGWNDSLVKDLKLKNSSLDAYAHDAKEFVKYLVEGKSVRLELDPDQLQVQNRDREGRVLAYVWFTSPIFQSPPDWLVMDPAAANTRYRYDAFLNASIIRAGYSTVETGWPFSFGGKFVTLEQEAKNAGRGVWKELSAPPAKSSAKAG